MNDFFFCFKIQLIFFFQMNGAAEVIYYDWTNFIPVGIKFTPKFYYLSPFFHLSDSVVKLHQFK